MNWPSYAFTLSNSLPRANYSPQVLSSRKSLSALRIQSTQPCYATWGRRASRLACALKQRRHWRKESD